MLEAHEALAALFTAPDAEARARALLGRYAARDLAALDAEALVACGGVTRSEALRVVAMFHFLCHCLRPPAGTPLTSSAEVAASVPELVLLPVEEVWVVAADAQLRPLLRARVARGRGNACDIAPADALVPVLRAHAAGFWLLHNHPSGDPTPSRDDLLVTERFAAVAALLGITFHDHLVVAGRSWVSCMSRAGSPRDRGTIGPAEALLNARRGRAARGAPRPGRRVEAGKAPRLGRGQEPDAPPRDASVSAAPERGS